MIAWLYCVSDHDCSSDELLYRLKVVNLFIEFLLRVLKDNNQSTVLMLEGEIRMQRMQLVDYEERLRALTAAAGGSHGAGCAMCKNYEIQVR